MKSENESMKSYNKIFWLYGLFLTALLSGCKTTPKANLMQFNPTGEPIYPSIRVVMTSQEMSYYSSRNAFLRALKEANVFKAIEVNNPYAEFVLEVHIETKDLSSKTQAESFTKEVIAGGTLGLVPLHTKFDSKGIVKLRYRGEVFDEFEFETKHASNVSLFSYDDDDAGASGVYRKAVEVILTKIEERQSFAALFQRIKQEQPASSLSKDPV